MFSNAIRTIIMQSIPTQVYQSITTKIWDSGQVYPDKMLLSQQITWNSSLALMFSLLKAVFIKK